MDNILIAICTIFVSLPFILGYIFFIAVWFGRGGSLINFYKFEPKGQKAWVYHKKLMRVISIYATIGCALIHACIVLSLFKYFALCAVFGSLGVLELVLGGIYIAIGRYPARLRELEKKFNESGKTEENL